MHEFKLIFNNFQKEKIFKKNIPEDVIEMLVTQIFIVGDFWPSNNALTLQLNQEAAKKHYANVFLNMFYLYLETPIQAEYSSYMMR